MTGPFIFDCTRVYRDGDRRRTVRRLEGMLDWLKYNREFRPGNALFVNGLRPHSSDKGYFSEAECRVLEEGFVREYEAGSDFLVPETPGNQFEVIGGAMVRKYHGYGPESHLPWI